MNFRYAASIGLLSLFSCTPDETSIAPTTDGNPVERFCELVARGQLEEAAQLVRAPARFYEVEEGYWVMAYPGNASGREWTVRALPDVWITRFKKGVLKSKNLEETEEDDPACFFLQTDIMCDPLQATVTFIPETNGITLVIDPIGDRKNYTLE